MAQDWRLAWGPELLAAPGVRTPTAAGYVIEALAQDMSFGNPESVVETVNSLISDGTLAVVQRWDNREVTLRVRLSAPEADAGPALAAAEAALMALVRGPDRPPPLVWTPPATNAAVTVMDVTAAKLERDYADEFDFQEARYEYRYFLLTLTCFPFVRGEERVTVPALAPNPPLPTFDLIDDCSTLTNWSVASEGFGAVARTNLVKNPSFEVDSSGWIDQSNPNVSRQVTTAQAFAGSHSLLIDRSNSVGDIRLWSPKIAVAAGLDYTASGYILNHTDEPSVYIHLTWIDGSGNNLSGTSGAVVVASGVWQRVTATGPAPAGAVKSEIRISVDSASVGAAFYADAFLFEQSSVVNPYFDGDTPASGSTDYYWTGTPHNSPSTQIVKPSAAVVASDAIEVTATKVAYGEGDPFLTLTRSAAVDMGVLPYLQVGMRNNVYDGFGGPGSAQFRVLIDGIWRFPVASQPDPANDVTKYYYATDDFTDLAFEWSSPAPNSSVSTHVAYIQATNTLPGLTKQKSRLLEVGGSARTQAKLRLFDETGPLGLDTLIYTSQSEFTPMLRRDWFVSGSEIAGPTNTVSGAFNNLDGTFETVFRVPVSQLDAGLYSLMVRLSREEATATLEWEVKLTDSAGADVIGSDLVDTGSLSVPGVSGGFLIHPLAQLHLPTVASEGDRYVQITLSNAEATDLLLDEVWLFNLTDGALTWLADGTVSIRHIEIRTPELDAPQPAVYASASADGSNAVDVSYLAKPLGTHELTPGQWQVFTVTTGSDESKSEGEFYLRHHSNVP